MTSNSTPGGPLVRAVFLTLGVFFTAVAFVGIFLPVLPTVPFLILAAGAFARSSKRLEMWLMTHRNFGPMLREWRDRGAIPRRGKLAALAGTSLGMVLFLTTHHHGPVAIATVSVIMASGLLYVFTRPTA